MPGQMCLRIRRVDEAANVAPFAAAWLVAELNRSWPVHLLSSDAELIELAVEPGRETRVMLTELGTLLSEHRFQGWELCHE